MLFLEIAFQFTSLLMASQVVFSRKITVKNSCKTTVWPGMHTGGGTAPDHVTGWEAVPGSEETFEVADNWTAGRIWARTGCVVQDGNFQCLTGQCGSGEGGDMTCMNTNTPPSTLAEFTLATAGEDNYDISLVDGFNVPLNIILSKSDCPQPTCMGNINPLCPPLLRTGLDSNGVNLGCLAACNAGFGAETYGNRACCTGSYNDPIMCGICGVDYYSLFKDNCNMSYAYAYDEKSESALWTCPSSPGSLSDYTIEFCPDGRDYVGSRFAGTEYLDATAKCTSQATSGPQTFSVPPSPSTTIAQGTLQVVATVATGLDGAAAIEIRPSPPPVSAATSPNAAAAVTSSAPAVVSGARLSLASSADQVVVVWETKTSTAIKTAGCKASAPAAVNLLLHPNEDEAVRGGQWLAPQKRAQKRSNRMTRVH
ncbi:thaumatin family-domain-containing protein [Kockovaella imperatae]|uniref:Thaumatin family-domain-containing protein n=1 Tax=Kockovaella imperatae TaxID=4999 RepID=A0A1Y1UTK7_9TREE|nr:thaumatin family-domain-containing protein [Kockovaella imperatae]ORX40766.1 thaumatin family-domain-containing protein [Kockovaella imperatae]